MKTRLEIAKIDEPRSFGASKNLRCIRCDVHNYAKWENSRNICYIFNGMLIYG
ncbi:MAG: hypothetical protein V1891_03760 [bacterium]